jgi:hypothetical protein
MLNITARNQLRSTPPKKNPPEEKNNKQKILYEYGATVE